MSRKHKRSRFSSDERVSSLPKTARVRKGNRERRKYYKRGSGVKNFRNEVSHSIEANSNIQEVRSRITRVAIPPRSRIVEKYDLRNVINCRTSRKRNARESRTPGITASPNIQQVRSRIYRVVIPPRSGTVERFDLRNVINSRTSRTRNARDNSTLGITANPNIQQVRNGTARVVIPPRKRILERFDLRNLINLRTSNTRNTRDNAPAFTADPDIQHVRKGSARVVIPQRSQNVESLDLRNEINLLTSRKRNARNNTTPVITANTNTQQEPSRIAKVVIPPQHRIVERYRLLNAHSVLTSRAKNARNNTTPVITANPNTQQVPNRTTRVVIPPRSRIVERYKLRNVYSDLNSRPSNAGNNTTPVFSDNPSTQKLQRTIPSAVIRPFSQNLVWPKHGTRFFRVRSDTNNTPSAITQDSHTQIPRVSSYIENGSQMETSDGYGLRNEHGFLDSSVRNAENDTVSAIAQDSATQGLLNRFSRINRLSMSENPEGYGYQNEDRFHVPGHWSSSNGSPTVNAQDTDSMQAPCTGTNGNLRIHDQTEEGYERWTEHSIRFYRFRNERD